MDDWLWVIWSWMTACQPANVWIPILSYLVTDDRLCQSAEPSGHRWLTMSACWAIWSQMTDYVSLLSHLVMDDWLCQPAELSGHGWLTVSQPLSETISWAIWSRMTDSFSLQSYLVTEDWLFHPAELSGHGWLTVSLPLSESLSWAIWSRMTDFVSKSYCLNPYPLTKMFVQTLCSLLPMAWDDDSYHTLLKIILKIGKWIHPHEKNVVQSKITTLASTGLFYSHNQSSGKSASDAVSQHPKMSMCFNFDAWNTILLIHCLLSTI
jgi:hypothetical protein